LIGIVFGGERGLYLRLTAQQNLRYWGALYGLGTRQARLRADELIERVGLTDRANDPVEGYSRGMKQRLHLARGLVGDPPVLLLDEPTTGMDPVAARDFRRLVTELRGEGRTILLTTHDMAEAEAVCDRVSLIDNGRLVATERPATLGTWLFRFERIDARDVPADVLADIAPLPGVASATAGSEGAVRIETTEAGAAAVVLQRLVERGVTSMSTSLASLEEVYLHIIGDRGMSVRR
jgi:ABC-2 type transport system ATP-binding protein